MAPDQTKVILAFRQALAQESHLLRRRPKITWQQLHNRLQWSSDRVLRLLEPERERRRGRGEPPWFQTRIPYRESRALIRTLPVPRGATFATFSADGSKIFSGASAWDTYTGRELPSLPVFSGPGSVVAVSADGTRAVTLDGYSCEVREVNTGQKLATCTAHEPVAIDVDSLSALVDYLVKSCAFSPDGSKVITGCWRFFAVWDASTGEVLARFPGNRSFPACAFSPDGKWVVTTSEWGDSCKVWDPDVATFRQEPLTFGGGQEAVTACVYSPDGHRIATGGADGSCAIWDAHSGEELRRFKGHEVPVMACSFGPDGSRIATGGQDAVCRIWGAGSGKELASFRGHTGQILSCAFSPDGTRVVTASSDESYKIWKADAVADVAAPSRRWDELLNQQGPVLGLTYGTQGPLVALGGSGMHRTVWNAENGKRVATLREEARNPSICVFSPNGQRMAAGDEGGTCAVWDLNTGERVATLEGHEAEITACAFSANGSFLVTGSQDMTCRVWSLANEDTVAVSEKHANAVAHCAVSPDGSRVVSTSSGACKLWDPATGKGLGSLYGHKGNVRACTFSPDGARVVTGSQDQTCKIWDADTRKELCTLRGHEGPVHACLFSPDGARIYSGSTDRTVKVWDSHSRNCLATLPLPSGVVALAHHPARASLACGPSGSSVCLADAVGVTLGPLVITAMDKGGGAVIRCPICSGVFGLDESWLGQDIPCPGEDCHGRIKVSPLVALSSPSGPPMSRI